MKNKLKKIILLIILTSLNSVYAEKGCAVEGETCYCEKRSIPHSGVSYLYNSYESFVSWCNGLTGKSKLPEIRLESKNNDKLGNAP